MRRRRRRLRKGVGANEGVDWRGRERDWGLGRVEEAEEGKEVRE